MNDIPNPPSPPVAPNPNISNKPTSGYAVAAMVIGILALVSCMAYGIPSLLLGPLAIVFSVAAKREIKRGKAGESSAGMATAGFICGLIGFILGAGFWLVMIGIFVIAAIAASMQP